MSNVPFSELVNNSIVTPSYGPDFGSGNRVDPFWSMAWPSSDGGPTIVWRSLRSEQALAGAGIRIPSRPGGRRHTRTQDEAISLLNRRRSRLVTFGTVNLWRTVTGQQLAAITGQSGLNSTTSDETGLLFDAGLIQRGRFHYAGRALTEFPEIFRPDPQASKVDLRQHLRFADWVGVTLGGPLMRGHQYDRHNILMAELSLRAAEICPLRSVLGEALATWTKLFDPQLHPNPYRSSDAVWIRDDGLKIAVELTAAVTVTTTKKIDQLADLLSRDTSKSLVVLFVVAAQPNDRRTGDVTNRLRQAVKRSSHSSRTRILANVEKRMAIVRWTDCFPGPGIATRDFVRLRAQRYSAVDDDWVVVDLLDPYDVPFSGAGSPEVAETSTNLNDVLGAPWWMRTGPGADFDEYLLEMSGFSKVLEIKAATDRDRPKGH